MIVAACLPYERLNIHMYTVSVYIDESVCTTELLFIHYYYIPNYYTPITLQLVFIFIYTSKVYINVPWSYNSNGVRNG